jgi:hypothetical protein
MAGWLPVPSGRMYWQNSTGNEDNGNGMRAVDIRFRANRQLLCYAF